MTTEGPKWPHLADLDDAITEHRAVREASPEGAPNASYAAVQQTAKGVCQGQAHRDRKAAQAATEDGWLSSLIPGVRASLTAAHEDAVNVAARVMNASEAEA